MALTTAQDKSLGRACELLLRVMSTAYSAKAKREYANEAYKLIEKVRGPKKVRAPRKPAGTSPQLMSAFKTLLGEDSKV